MRVDSRPSLAPGYRALLVLTALYFFMLPILDGFQQLFYLIHIIPMFAAALAAWIHWGIRRRLAAPVVAVIVVCLVGIQLSVSGDRIVKNPYGTSYLRAAQFLKTHMTRDTVVMGSAEWAFELGFDGSLIDDFRLGFRSGKKADLIIIDERRYAEWISHLAMDDPANYRYIQRMLNEQFQLVYDQPFYKIFTRYDSGDVPRPGLAVPNHELTDARPARLHPTKAIRPTRSESILPHCLRGHDSVVPTSRRSDFPDQVPRCARIPSGRDSDAMSQTRA